RRAAARAVPPDRDGNGAGPQARRADPRRDRGGRRGRRSAARAGARVVSGGARPGRAAPPARPAAAPPPPRGPAPPGPPAPPRRAADPPLLRDLADADTQVQPPGVDLRLESVWRFLSAGALRRDRPGAPTRALPEREPLAFDADGALHLAPGAYLVRFVEVVHLPDDVMALARPRSSLLRCGAALHTAVGDAGYAGRSEALLSVGNPHGLA